jgi:hypothetical protein
MLILGMPKVEQIVWKCVCVKCGHEWVTRSYDVPVRCAKCNVQGWEGVSKWAGDEVGQGVKFPVSGTAGFFEPGASIAAIVEAGPDVDAGFDFGS